MIRSIPALAGALALAHAARARRAASFARAGAIAGRRSVRPAPHARSRVPATARIAAGRTGVVRSRRLDGPCQLDRRELQERRFQHAREGRHDARRRRRIGGSRQRQLQEASALSQRTRRHARLAGQRSQQPRGRRSSRSPAGPSTLTADQAQIDGAAKVYKAIGNVHYVQADTVVDADTGTLNDADAQPLARRRRPHRARRAQHDRAEGSLQHR